MGLTPRRRRRDLLGYRPLRGGKVRALDPFYFAALPSASEEDQNYCRCITWGELTASDSSHNNMPQSGSWTLAHRHSCVAQSGLGEV